MPVLKIPRDFGYSDHQNVKQYLIDQEQYVQKIAKFFPVLWDPAFSEQFVSTIKLALQFGEDFTKSDYLNSMGKDINTQYDIYLILERLEKNKLNTIVSRQGGDYPAYWKQLLSSYDMLPILIGDYNQIIDGHHRFSSYLATGISPLILKISIKHTSEKPMIISQYDESVKNKEIIFPKAYEQSIEDFKEENTLQSNASKKIPLSQIKKMPYSMLNRMLSKLRKYLKEDETVQKMFKEYEVDIQEIDYIPMKFGDLDVSAKTDHGVIIYSYNLLTDGDFFKDFSYGVHEITHWLQQTTGSKPTQSSDDGNYLQNPFEQEGFANQIGYISDNFGKNEAEKYVDHLLDYHEVKDKNQKDELEAILLEKA